MTHETIPLQFTKRRTRAKLAVIQGRLTGTYSLPLGPSLPFIDAHTTERLVMCAQREDHIIQRFVDTLQPDSVFWDVGACFGLWSIHALQQLQPWQVVAFEPVHMNVRRLRKHASCELWEIAVSDERKHVHIQPDEPGNARIDPGKEGNVKTFPLQEIIGIQQPPTHLKLDIEGHEPQALDGLDHNPEHVFVEHHDNRHAITSRLSIRGYSCLFEDHRHMYWVLGNE